MTGALYLIGLPATGKTTLGTAVHAAAGIPFVDLDATIEARLDMSVSEIFARMGEDVFRRIESEELRRLGAAGGLIACGGGTPCRDGNMDYMLATGCVVCLHADRRVILARMAVQAGLRPLAGQSPAEAEAYLDACERERGACYARAHCTFDSSRLDTPAEIEETTARFIQEFIKDN